MTRREQHQLKEAGDIIGLIELYGAWMEEFGRAREQHPTAPYFAETPYCRAQTVLYDIKDLMEEEEE